jgi:hypothetical protein
VTDRRGVLESIAYGEDPEIRVGDRLRALELLAQLDELALEELLFRDTAHATPEELDTALDAGLAVVVGEILAGRGEEIAGEFPVTLGVVEGALDRRAREIAFEMCAAEEPVYAAPQESHAPPVALDEPTDVQPIENERAEIADRAGPWELLGHRWRSD